MDSSKKTENLNQDKLSEAFEKKRIIRSEEIFFDKKEVIIIHGSESYRLLHTKNGKLILIK